MKNFDEVPRAESERVKHEELNPGAGLIERMSTDNFKPVNYRDEYRLRAWAMIEERVEGYEIATPPEPTPRPGPMNDLLW
jgi:non-homologous end joining protein Ku